MKWFANAAYDGGNEFTLAVSYTLKENSGIQINSFSSASKRISLLQANVSLLYCVGGQNIFANIFKWNFLLGKMHLEVVLATNGTMLFFNKTSTYTQARK